VPKPRLIAATRPFQRRSARQKAILGKAYGVFDGTKRRDRTDPHESRDVISRQFPGARLHLFALSINNWFVMHRSSPTK